MTSELFDESGDHSGTVAGAAKQADIDIDVGYVRTLVRARLEAADDRRFAHRRLEVNSLSVNDAAHEVSVTWWKPRAQRLADANNADFLWCP
jgi:hypothetical protein